MSTKPDPKDGAEKMSESKHTPGPWEAYDRRPVTGNFATRIPFAIVLAGRNCVAPIADVCDQPQAEANARLIAAAPELLAELIAVRAALEAIEAHCVNKRGLTGLDHADEGRRIRASIQAILATPSAISKATGAA